MKRVLLTVLFLLLIPLKVKAAEKEAIPFEILPKKAALLFTEEFTEEFLEICSRYETDYRLMLALIEAESGFDPSASNGTHYGLCQISSVWHGERAETLGVTDLYDPVGNVLVGADYLRELLDRDRGVTYALNAYRFGEKAAEEKYKNGETSAYARSIEERTAELKDALKTENTDMKKIKTQPDECRPEKDTDIRPACLDDYVGQEEIKNSLRISIKAAELRNTPLDHFLFSGPPGLGKTSLAAVIAYEAGVRFKSVNAPVIEKPKDMAAILASLEDRDILFIDEIHRLPKNVEEMLYQAMEDQKIDIIIGDAQQTKAVSMQLAPFTLIGATTREGLLSKPLLDRFRNKYAFDYYSDAELEKIAGAAAVKYDTPISEDTARLIGTVSRGTPRIAVNITKRLSDYMIVKGMQDMDGDGFYRILSAMGINREGFTSRETKYLDILKSTYEKTGKPVGLKTVCAYMGETEDTVEDVIEPYLLRKKMIAKMSAGRIPVNR